MIRFGKSCWLKGTRAKLKVNFQCFCTVILEDDSNENKTSVTTIRSSTFLPFPKFASPTFSVDSMQVTAFPKMYLFTVNDRISRKRCGMCSKLTIKTPEQRHAAKKK